MKELRIDRGSLEITLRCTLKCKLCAAYAPFHEIPPHYSVEYMAKTLEKYFEIVDHVGDFSISGGEPLMHNEIDEIIKHVFKYKNQFDRFLILTNGTLVFKESTLAILKELSICKDIQINISHYGSVSSRVDDLTEQLDKTGIKYRVINYHDENLFSGGWIDYGDHTQKIFTLEERDKVGEDCVFAGMNSAYITRGQVHRCARTRRRMELGVIPFNNKEYVDLFDDSLSVQEKKEVLRYIVLEAKSITSCAYCNGMHSDSKRYPPAEQLP